MPLIAVFENNTGTCLVYIAKKYTCTACARSLSKKVCSYTGAAWLKVICQSEDGERRVSVDVIQSRPLTEVSSKCHNQNKKSTNILQFIRVQELCESRGGRHGLSVLMSLTVSVDVKQH